MPETPDFDQIARRILAPNSPEQNPALWKGIDPHDYDASQETYPSGRSSTGRFAAPIDQTYVSAIAEQLRQVWNARGAADREAVRDAPNDRDGAPYPDEKYIIDEIGKLDR